MAMFHSYVKLLDSTCILFLAGSSRTFKFLQDSNPAFGSGKHIGWWVWNSETSNKTQNTIFFAAEPCKRVINACVLHWDDMYSKTITGWWCQPIPQSFKFVSWDCEFPKRWTHNSKPPTRLYSKTTEMCTAMWRSSAGDAPRQQSLPCFGVAVSSRTLVFVDKVVPP